MCFMSGNPQEHKKWFDGHFPAEVLTVVKCSDQCLALLTSGLSDDLLILALILHSLFTVVTW